MIVPIAPIAEYDGSVTHRHIIIFIEKLVVADLEHLSRFAEFGVSKGQRQVLVIASQRLNPNCFTIDPSEPRHVVIAAMQRDSHPDSLTAARRHYAQAYVWIRVAGLRKALPIH